MSYLIAKSLELLDAYHVCATSKSKHQKPSTYVGGF